MMSLVLTFLSQVTADKGCIDVFQKNDALLWSDTKKMVEAIVRKAGLAQIQQADAVLKASWLKNAHLYIF